MVDVLLIVFPVLSAICITRKCCYLVEKVNREGGKNGYVLVVRYNNLFNILVTIIITIFRVIHFIYIME